jgi:hypothetical protein
MIARTSAGDRCLPRGREAGFVKISVVGLELFSGQNIGSAVTQTSVL